MARKQKEILVSVVKKSDRNHLVYKWEDRVADTRGEETTETTSRRTAKSHERMTALIESIVARRKPKAVDPTWAVFRARYERSRKTVWRPKTLAAWTSAANKLEALVPLEKLSDLGAGAIDDFCVALHGTVSAPTVDSYLRSIRAAVRWAAEIYPAYTAPRITVSKAPSKGRPLANREFDDMLKKCVDVVGQEKAGSWRFLLEGLVWSGLRLQQALDLSWEIEAPLHVEALDSPHPRLHIAASGHKGGREQQLPILPPLASLLRQVPNQQRTAFVFNPKSKQGGTVRNVSGASALICEIGEAAGIVTGERLQREKGKVTGKVPRYAGAHDLKRTFVERLLAKGFHPAKIAQLAQHRTFDVTQHHYAGHDVRQLSEYAQGLFEAAETET